MAATGSGLQRLSLGLRAALEREWDERRFFLWLPIAAGAGVVLYFQADREPSRWAALLVAAFAVAAVFPARHHRRALIVTAGIAAAALGFASATLRTATIDHPTLNRIRIARLVGTVEAVDHRRTGARFLLQADPTGFDGLPSGSLLVRLTTRRSDPIEAGDRVAVTARLLPPARAALPGGYSFARDAYFSGFAAVGSAMGRITAQPAANLTLAEGFNAAVDRARNTLAERVSSLLPGDTGAIAAAMVTGKRDLLSEDGRELIREAGIFHIITIAGVQMTLVAGLLFFGLRAGLAAIPSIALRFPIKAWAAAGAMLGAVGYDLLTGSRIGTQRALFMTLVMLGAILVKRRAFTMRNLALAALVVVLVEPETILGASFQLSFAAVAALISVSETGVFSAARAKADFGPVRGGHLGWLDRLPDLVRGGGRHLGRLVFSTVAATGATAPVMASNFHEISPFVVVGNPLTLAIIEFFAVPGALLGSILYPLGLDRFVWIWVGWGIEIVLWAARHIAALPGASLNVPAFASWSLGCFALATASAVIWRSPILRCTALPFFALGLYGAMLGARYDLIVAPTGDSLAWRDRTGSLALAGKVNVVGASQWLTADGDGRVPAAAMDSPDLRCDAAACVVHGPADKLLSLVVRPEAFEDDCRRVDAIVTPLYAPASCAAEVIVDRGTLARSGALGFNLRNGAFVATPDQAPGQDRPWARQPPASLPRRPPATRPDTSEDEPTAAPEGGETP